MDITSLIIDTLSSSLKTAPALVAPLLLYFFVEAKKEIAKQKDELRDCWRKSTIFETKSQLLQEELHKHKPKDGHTIPKDEA